MPSTSAWPESPPKTTHAPKPYSQSISWRVLPWPAGRKLTLQQPDCWFQYLVCLLLPHEFLLRRQSFPEERSPQQPLYVFCLLQHAVSQQLLHVQGFLSFLPTLSSFYPLFLFLCLNSCWKIKRVWFLESNIK